MDLVLASASPRRQSILAQLGFTFRVVPSDADESLDGIELQDAPAELACRKAMAVSLQHPDATVLGFDTLVYLDGVPLGKPTDKEHAHTMLSALQGREHQVITGVSVCRQGLCLHKSQEITGVLFRMFTEREMLDYIDTLEPMDKAGAYGIQGKGARLVRSVNGCYYNVVGLPVARTLDALSSL